MDDLSPMLADLKKGKRGAIAKAITLVENDPKKAKRLLKRIYGETGGSSIIGITGPAGAGKSSLINKTAVALRELDTKPAVLAVDPTSHITGGAILGDRVRMSESTDSGTYIRSIASRGATGAVSRSLRDSIRILEYAGFDPVIIESVGAGQTEVEISRIADITVVVFNPHTGDSIQTIKAGLTEIGDIYLVNKSDLSGAGQLFNAVMDFIGDGGAPRGGDPNKAAATSDDGPSPTSETTTTPPPVLKTSVKRNTGISEFARVLKEMMVARKGPDGGGDQRNRERLRAEMRDIILNNIREKVDDMLESDGDAAKHLSRAYSRSVSPYVAADRITGMLLKK